ncbi:MAG: CoA transferase, partial [Candidatus Competibacterales bacterium]|nr:CoA transferase [Candidatus Competibacterales bacterium]
MVLADLGATVVHVDPPSGPLWHTPANATLNRNKLCVAIDLKTDEGLEQAHALIAQADIVIESFRYGVMKRLGIDFSALRMERPELITLSIPGFASNDTLRREWRAFESVVAAASGMFTDMGLNRVLMGINPSFSPLPLTSAYGTMLAASSAVLALQAREHTGLGDAIEVPLAAALMEGLCYNSIHVEGMPERYKTQREQEIEYRRTKGLRMDMDYDELQDLLDPFFRTYRCKDNRMFYIVCPSHKGHVRRCLQALGIYDDLVAEGLSEEDDTYKPTCEWEHQISLGVYPLPSKQWADHITERIEEVMITRTSSYWQKVFGEGRFPGAPHRWLEEWLEDPHAHEAGLLIEVDDPEYGPMTQPGPMVWLEESGQEMLTPRPRRFVDFEQALAALAGIDKVLPEITQPDSTAGWMEGVRILDLCNVIAGPHSVTYLTRFGAEVIKLDPVHPLYDCWNMVVYGLSHMRSKRSVLADITKPEGWRIFEQLVQSVDVVVWNATDRQVQKMGLDAEGLRAINPEVVFCQLDCFGGVKKGPRTNYLGYDDLVQAATGIMLRFGGSMETPEEHAHVGTIDVMCGFGAALGVATALYQKSRTGRAGRARTSLSALSGLAQLPFCYDYKGRGPFDEPSGRDANGFDELIRFYHASDQFLLLHAYEDDVQRFDQLPEMRGFSKLPRSERAEFLAHVFPTARAEHWVHRLQEIGIGAAVCDTLETIRAEASRPADGGTGIDRGSYSFSVFEDHPSGHT